LDKLGQDYAAQGLVVLAMNVEGSQRSYQKFIEENPYSHLQWARDTSGEIAELYLVHGVPTTYILDTEGVIQHAHVGYGSGMEGLFAQEIEGLLE
jgi:hypothetical protein